MNKIATTTKNPLREKLGVKPAAEAIPYLNFLVYGEPGAGKTYLAGTAQDHKETSPVLVLDVEGGTTTLRHRQDVDVRQVRSIDDIISIHRSLVENPGYYKTVVIDSLTELQKLDMAEIMKEAVSKRVDQDPDTPAQRDWGKSSNRIRRIVRGYRDLDCNTILTALVTIEKDGQSQALTFYPSLPGKLKTEIAGFIDVVGYIYSDNDSGEVIRRIQFAQTRRVIAKDRTSSLGDVIENPTIPMMFDLIHNNHKET